MRFLFGDITSDGLQVGCNSQTQAIAFGFHDVPIGEGALFVRAALFASEHVAIVRTHQTDRAKLVTDTGRIVDLGPNVGNWSVGLRPSADGTRLHVLWMETTANYQYRVYKDDWTIESHRTVSCPNTSTGFREVSPEGVPIFTDAMIGVTINGIRTHFATKRQDVWVAQRGVSGQPDALIAIKGERVQVLYPGLAHEPHLTEAPNGSLLVAFRADGGGARFLSLDPETLAFSVLPLQNPIPEPEPDPEPEPEPMPEWTPGPATVYHPADQWFRMLLDTADDRVKRAFPVTRPNGPDNELRASILTKQVVEGAHADDITAWLDASPEKALQVVPEPEPIPPPPAIELGGLDLRGDFLTLKPKNGSRTLSVGSYLDIDSDEDRRIIRVAHHERAYTDICLGLVHRKSSAFPHRTFDLYKADKRAAVKERLQELCEDGIRPHFMAGFEDMQEELTAYGGFGKWLKGTWVPFIADVKAFTSAAIIGVELREWATWGQGLDWFEETAAVFKRPIGWHGNTSYWGPDSADSWSGGKQMSYWREVKDRVNGVPVFMAFQYRHEDTESSGFLSTDQEVRDHTTWISADSRLGGIGVPFIAYEYAYRQPEEKSRRLGRLALKHGALGAMNGV